jgi:hypothetical protein
MLPLIVYDGGSVQFRHLDLEIRHGEILGAEIILQVLP